MSNQRFTLRAAIYLILQKDNKYLLLRRNNTGYRDGEYTLPAGHVEANETFLETCIREAKEEVCVDIEEKDLKLVHVMQRHEGDVDVVDYYFLVQNWAGKEDLGEPHKADKLEWLALYEIKEKGIHFISKAIEKAEENVCFSHDGVIY